MNEVGRVESFRNGMLHFTVSDEGPIDGAIVILLHGFPQNHRCWGGVRQALHASGHRTIAYDQRGYAPQARPRGRFAYRAKALASDVLTLIELLKPRPVSIVGHDWGALVAWTIAATRPDAVTTLTTVSVPHPRAFLSSLLSSDQGRRAVYMALFQLPWFPEWWIRRHRRTFGATLSGTGMSPPEVERVIADVVPSPALTGGINWYRAMALTSPRRTAPVAVPTTHVWSTSDTSLARSGAELTGRYVKADYRLEILNGSHWIPNEHPAKLAALIAERVGTASDHGHEPS